MGTGKQVFRQLVESIQGKLVKVAWRCAVCSQTGCYLASFRTAQTLFSCLPKEGRQPQPTLVSSAVPLYGPQSGFWCTCRRTFQKVCLGSEAAGVCAWFYHILAGISHHLLMREEKGDLQGTLFQLSVKKSR